MQPLDLALRIVLLGLSVIMLIISMQAWRRVKGRRMTWVMFSFLGFAALSATALLGELTDDAVWGIPNIVVLILIFIIGTNYLALLKG